jgi:hypothetical protein
MMKLKMARAASAGIRIFIVGLILGGSFGIQAFSQEIIPYLQSPTESSIWITWKTSSETESLVRYGTDPTSLENLVTGGTEILNDPEYSGNYYYHSAHVKNLQPSTSYYYKVISGSMESDTFQFKTQPVNGSQDDHFRFLIFGDHQNPNHDGYQRLMWAAQERVFQKYGGPVQEHINLIINDGDQVDQGSLWQYENIHFAKSAPLSPWLPIMTAVGNHETYGSLGLDAYYPHFFYDSISYKGITSPGGENYYSFQTGGAVFVMASTEHPDQQQVDWIQQIVDSVKVDDQVDWLFSVGHRPIQAEQYVGDISVYFRDQVIPVLAQTEKSVLFIGGHHHLYARGQLRDFPMYHIISGGASWDQFWGQSTEIDFDDVQKTIDYWAYQIVDIDLSARRMEVECYAIGSPLLGFTLDNILIDSFHREFGKTAPLKPQINTSIPDTIQLPFTITSSDFQTGSDEDMNSTQFQFSYNEEFTDFAVDLIRDFENLYGTTGEPDYLPVDIHENLNILEYLIRPFELPNGKYFVRVRHRDQNTLWSEWSDTESFVITGSTEGFPEIWTQSEYYNPDEPFDVFFQNGPNNPLDWIGIYKKGDTPGVESSTDWEYVNGSSGSVTLQVSAPGEYFIALFANDGYTEITERVAVYIISIPEVNTSKPAYDTNEQIVINYSNAPSLINDWIGIYKVHDVPGTVGSTDWAYVSGQSGSVTFNSLAGGYYFANYFLLNAYAEPGEREYFTVGDDLAVVSTNKSTYAPGENIIIYWQKGPGLANDLIKIFKEGEEVPLDSIETNGAQSGRFTYSGTLDTARYYLALHINGSGQEVSNQAAILISTDVVSSGYSPADETLRVYPSPTHGHLFIDVNNSIENIRAISATTLSGKTVLLQKFPGNQKLKSAVIDLSENEPGIYLIRVTTDHMSSTRKVVLY